MDTKLKSYKSYQWKSLKGAGYVLAWIVSVAAAVISLVLLTLLVTMEDTYGWALENDMGASAGYFSGFYAGYISSPEAMERFITQIGIACVAAAVLAVLMLAVILLMTGRFGRDTEGMIHLSWFDRIWSEVQLALGVFAVFAAIFCMDCLWPVWVQEKWFSVFTPFETNSSFYGAMPNELAMILSILGIAGSVILLYCSASSLVKKLKARSFWRCSLIGGICLLAYYGWQNNSRTTIKTVILLIAGGVVCATLIGLPVMVILILIFVPKLLKKYERVRSGAEEVRNGNLDYRISVKDSRNGRKDELDRLAEDINAISDAQVIAVQNELKNQKMRTELISNVSHDLKTPLTSMITYIDLMKKEGLDSPNAAEYLDIIDSKTDRLRVLTEDLFEAAKAASGDMPVNMGSIDMGAMVSQSLAETGEKLQARHLEVHIRNECEGNCHVKADGQLLWRVMENLLSNVSKYAMEGSRVYLNIRRTAPDENRIMLEVKNISENPLNISSDELMERFTRGDESRNTEGSGLGLAIARDLVHLMKGEFEITIDGDLFKAALIFDGAEEEKNCEHPISSV